MFAANPTDVIEKARQLIDQAQVGIETFKRRAAGSLEEVQREMDPLADLLEEAQSLLLETDVGDPTREIVGSATNVEPETSGSGTEAESDEPDAEEPETGGSEEDGSSEEQEPLGAYEAEDGIDEESEAYVLMNRKQELEHRSRILEASLYRSAADKIGSPLVEPGTATEEQDEMLRVAVVALESAVGARPDGETLLRLAELLLLQLEVRKARRVCEICLEFDPEGEGAEAARKLLNRIDSDRKLKDKGQCFIATAACGTPDAPAVQTLRRFRERCLRPGIAGRALIQAYEWASPPLARLIEQSETARRITRRLLVLPLARVAASRVKTR